MYEFGAVERVRSTNWPGVQTTEFIPVGAVIGEYTGELTTHDFSQDVQVAEYAPGKTSYSVDTFFSSTTRRFSVRETSDCPRKGRSLLDSLRQLEKCSNLQLAAEGVVTLPHLVVLLHWVVGCCKTNRSVEALPTVELATRPLPHEYCANVTVLTDAIHVVVHD